MLDSLDTSKTSKRHQTIESQYVTYLNDSKCYMLHTDPRIEESALMKFNASKLSPTLMKSTQATS